MKNIKKFLINYYPFIIFLGLILYFCRKFVFQDGYFFFSEYFESTDYSFTLKQFLKSWTEYTALGYTNISPNNLFGFMYSFQYPAASIPYYAYLAIIQLLFGVFKTKAVIIITLFLPFLGMYLFSNYWFKQSIPDKISRKLISFLTGFVFTVNWQIGERVYAGHIGNIIGSGLFPLLLCSQIQAIETNNGVKRKYFILLSALFYLALFVVTPHLIILSAMVLGFYFLIFVIGSKTKLARFFAVVFFSLLIFIFLSTFAWLPPIFFGERFFTVTDPTFNLWYVYFSSRLMNFTNIVRLYFPDEVQFLSANIQKNILILKSIISVSALLGFIISKKNKKTFFIMIISIIGIILSMGINYPFERMYIFLYKNIFLFKPFRDPSKFLILYTFSISLFIGYLFLFIKKNFSNLFAFLLVIFIFIVVVANPFFSSGNFNNNFSVTKLPKKYEQLNQFLDNQKGNYHIEILPSDANLSQYNWVTKIPPLTSHLSLYAGFFPLKKNPLKLGQSITSRTYHLIDFLEENINSNWAINKYADLMTRYIIIDDSYIGYEKYVNLLENNNLLNKITSINGFTVFEIKNYRQSLIEKKPAVYYQGTMSGLKYLPKNLAIINLNLNPLDILQKNHSSVIVLSQSSLDDILLGSLKAYWIDFSQELRFNTDGLKQFLASIYINQFTKRGVAPLNPNNMFTNGPNLIKKQLKFTKGKYKIFISVFDNDEIGNETTNNILVSLDNKKVKLSDFKKNGIIFHWLDFGEFNVNNTNAQLVIKNLENKYLNIDSVTIIPVSVYETKLNEFRKMIKFKQIYDVEEIKNPNLLLNNSKNITTMARSYSPYWSLCNKPIFVVDFYGIGSNCDKNDIKPIFTPNSLYAICLIVSSLFFLSLILYIIRLKSSNTNNV